MSHLLDLTACSSPYEARSPLRPRYVTSPCAISVTLSYLTFRRLTSTIVDVPHR